MLFLDILILISTLSTDIRVHRAGSQLKIVLLQYFFLACDIRVHCASSQEVFLSPIIGSAMLNCPCVKLWYDPMSHHHHPLLFIINTSVQSSYLSETRFSNEQYPFHSSIRLIKGFSKKISLPQNCYFSRTECPM